MWSSAWLLLVTFSTFVASVAASELQQEALNNCKWMRSIRDQVLVSDLVLPGTHDSCAIRVNAYAKTQTRPVRQQLQSGIRYFDLRVGGCEHTSHKLCLYHSDFYLKVRLDDVVRSMVQFLQQFPSEALFMRLKHEHDAKDAPVDDFQGFVEQNYLANSTGASAWFQPGNLSVHALQMHHVRGHMVIFWDDGPKTSKWGYDYNLVNTRNFWDFDNVVQMFHVFQSRAQQAKSVAGWYENPTSGVVGLVPIPVEDADQMNPMVLEYLTAYPDTKGIISMDAPPIALINKLIELNTPFHWMVKPHQAQESTSAVMREYVQM